MSTQNPADESSTAIENTDETTVEIAIPDTADETTDWEAIARDSAATLLLQALTDVDETVHRVEYRLSGHANDTLDAADVRAARNALYELETVLEETVAPAVDDVESYERSAEHVPFDALADRLGVEL